MKETKTKKKLIDPVRCNEKQHPSMTPSQCDSLLQALSDRSPLSTLGIFISISYEFQ